MFNGSHTDPKTMFIELECYQPYYTIDKDGYPSYEVVKKHTFKTKIRLDMIARVDDVDTFIATPKGSHSLDKTKEEWKEMKYKKVVVLCHTNLGLNGFQDSLYITERCFAHLDGALEDAFGETLTIPEN